MIKISTAKLIITIIFALLIVIIPVLYVSNKLDIWWVILPIFWIVYLISDYITTKDIEK